MGVTGGTPLGFDVGAKGAGGTLPGLDLVRDLLPPLHAVPANLCPSNMAGNEQPLRQSVLHSGREGHEGGRPAKADSAA